MDGDVETLPAYVVKAADFPALYYLDQSHPRPARTQWINRATDQPLRRSTIEMLLRTMFVDTNTPSVRKLHQTSGLRASFSSDRDRDRFARVFDGARSRFEATHDTVLTAAYDDEAAAERIVSSLHDAAIPREAISLVWRTSQYLDADYRAEEGHSVTSVAGTMLGSGLAGAMLGVGVLVVPGVGPVAVAGALTASAFGSIAAVSGIIGATGGAIAKMLSDHDVDGVSAGLYEQEIRRGKVFLSIDTRKCADRVDEADAIIRQSGKRSRYA
ncbi:hypothetical protein K3172_08885 [Qipengyuania sp. 6B39]|nr:hypothetical protein [Qipengyuania proteolytica]